MESDEEFLDKLTSSQRTTYEDDEAPMVTSSPNAPGAYESHSTLKALALLAETGTNLENVLEDVLFGDTDLQSEPAIYDARKRFFDSGVLIGVLTRIRNPPGMRVRGNAHRSARELLENWALETSQEILCAELAEYAKTTKAPGTETEVVNEESLKYLIFDSILDDIKQHAPKLFQVLTNICTGSRSERNKHKDPTFVSE